MKEPMYLSYAVKVADKYCAQCKNFMVAESENKKLPHCKYLAICLNALDLREGEKNED